LSRRAGDADGALARIYRLALTILVAIAIPVATLLTWTAYPISRLLWGETFLPESARALQILIWFLPLSFINGLTQYVLIALGLQSRITVAFAIAAAFNLAANLILIPSFGYRAAAVVTIATEAVLLAPFVRGIGSRIPLNTLAVAILRPVPAAILFAGIIVAITPLTDWGAGILACAVYPLALWFGGAITPDDRQLLLTVVRQTPSTGAS
jgi:O-antigen/teichoic acid export membrane protein